MTTTNDATKKPRRPAMTLSQAVGMDLDSLRRATSNLLVDNKNFTSGYYFDRYPSTRDYVRYVLKEQAQLLLDKIDGAKEIVVSALDDCLKEADELEAKLSKAEKAFRIADEAMIAQLEAHCVLGQGTAKIGLVNSHGEHVKGLADAEPAIIEAAEWLMERNLITKKRDESGDYFMLTLPGQSDIVIEIESPLSCWLADWTGDPGRTLKPENALRFASEAAAQAEVTQLQQRYPGRAFTVGRLPTLAQVVAPDEQDNQNYSPAVA